ncbi:MAG: NAD(P)-dependent oxidoreductase [Gammaproteobacteria bacterium]|nr:NAD(P)-dependent oxidoreductase [Gammaproteobacteria bacterium]
MMHVLVTGGAGYVGSLLCPQLLDIGYRVTAYDICYFGTDFLPISHPNFTLVQGDIRDTARVEKALKHVDVVIHLACISNDASFDLDERLSTTVNLDAFEPLVKVAKASGVKRFIYASSSSVYGVSDAPEVTEEHPLVPLTLYNKYKGLCEPLLFKHQSADFICVTIRPATLCGYAPRQRLDLSVNILTNHAVNTGQIKVFGGTQLRPNLHVQDMCDLYKRLIDIESDKIAGKIFNCGFQNLSILEIAQIVKQIVQEEFPEKGEIDMITTPTDDIRSYHISSAKIQHELGFKPKFTIQDAVHDLCRAFRRNDLKDSMTNDIYFNVQRLKALNIT